MNTKYTKEQSMKSIEFSAQENGIISGYASVFDVVDAYNDIVKKGAFSKAIEQFNLGKKPKLLWQHDVRYPIGIIEEMFEDNYGLFIKAKLLLDVPQAKEAYCLLKNDAVNGFSIGYRINQKHNQNGMQLLTDINLLEISIVTFPACEVATVSEVKNVDEGKIMNKEIQNEIKELNENISNYMRSNNQTINEIRRNIIGKTLPLSENTTNCKNSDFEEYIRSGIENFSKKSLNASDENGALLLPKDTANKIEETIKYISPMRAICRKITISGNSVDILVDDKNLDAGWSGKDTEERLETDAPKFRKISIAVNEIYARPKASQQLLDDSKVDIEQWLIAKIAEKFAMLENQSFLNGDGNDKPRGFLNYETSADEKRDFGKLQHFITGEKGKFKDDEKAVNLLIDMAYSLKSNYLKNAKWLMSRSALSAIRKLKNLDGTSLWQPALSETSPSTLLGYPVIIDDDMPELKEGTASKSIAFGDFEAGYQIVDRQELSILRDPYTSKPFVEFYATKRIGGAVVDFDAIKVLKFDEE